MNNDIHPLAENKNHYIHQVIKSPILAQDTTLGKNFTKFFWGMTLPNLNTP